MNVHVSQGILETVLFAAMLMNAHQVYMIVISMPIVKMLMGRFIADAT